MENKSSSSPQDQENAKIVAAENARPAAPKESDQLIERQKEAQNKPVETEFKAEGSISSEN